MQTKSNTDVVLLIVVIWMFFSRAIYQFASTMFEFNYNSLAFMVWDTISSLIWGFIPLGLALVCKNQTIKIALLILGSIYLVVTFYDIFVKLARF